MEKYYTETKREIRAKEVRSMSHIEVAPHPELQGCIEVKYVETLKNGRVDEDRTERIVLVTSEAREVAKALIACAKEME